MKINPIKLERQEVVCEKWLANKGIGVFEAVTGFGKTYVAILLIMRMNAKAPDKTINIIVPSLKLQEDWLDEFGGYITLYNLKNVQVYVVNSYTRTGLKWECDFLIADEVHHILSDDAEQFNKVLSNTSYKYFLGLTATLSDKEYEFLNNVDIKIIDKVTMDEAEELGFISQSVSYNLGLTLNEEDAETYKNLTRQFNSAFSKFNHNFDMAKACLINGKAKVNGIWRTGDDWRRIVARENGWDGVDAKHYWSPKSIQGYAAQFNKAMVGRKQFIYNASVKLDTATEIIKKLDLQTIVFSESTKFADDLYNKVKSEIGNIIRPYHSKVESELRTEQDLFGNDKKPKKIGKGRLKKESLALFEDLSSPIRVISAVKALDEGYNVDNISLVIMASYTSSARRETQRKGRGVRFVAGKLAIIVNLYLKSYDDVEGSLVKSQEEKWLKEKQNGSSVIWVDSVDELIEDVKLRLDGNISANKTQTVSSAPKEDDLLRYSFK